jgi:hypothetical protein
MDEAATIPIIGRALEIAGVCLALPILRAADFVVAEAD